MSKEVLVEGEDSSEEDDEEVTVPGGAGTAAATAAPAAPAVSPASAAGAFAFDPATFAPRPPHPVHAAVHDALLPDVQAQLAALRQLTQSHEDLLGCVSRERRDLDRLAGEDLRAAQEVLRLAPQYEARIKGMMQKMVQLNAALVDMGAGSEALLQEVAAGVEAQRRYRAEEAEFEAAHTVVQARPAVASSSSSSAKGEGSKDGRSTGGAKKGAAGKGRDGSDGGGAGGTGARGRGGGGSRRGSKKSK